MALGQTGGPMTLALFHNRSFCESDETAFQLNQSFV